jgi:hypothetical protein
MTTLKQIAQAEAMPKRADDDDLPRLTRTGETRLADALTVFWMITVMQVLLFQLATVGFRWYYHRHPEQPQIGALSELLYLCAVLGGCISLLLFPLVWKLRRNKPPLGITLFATITAALPIVAMLLGIGLRK